MNDQKPGDITEITQQLYVLLGWLEFLKRGEPEQVKRDRTGKLVSASISIQEALKALEKI